MYALIIFGGMFIVCAPAAFLLYLRIVVRPAMEYKRKLEEWQYYEDHRQQQEAQRADLLRRRDQPHQ